MQARMAKLESEAHHIQSDIAQIKTDIRELRSDNKILLEMIHTRCLALWELGCAPTTRSCWG